MGVGLLPPNWLDGADYIGNQTATWLTYSRFEWATPIHFRVMLVSVVSVVSAVSVVSYVFLWFEVHCGT